MDFYRAADAAPAIPAAESALGSHPCVALSSAQVLPEWINCNLAANAFASNGDNPLNFVSRSRGSVQPDLRVFQYFYSATQNNGRITGASHLAGGATEGINYYYDSLNRLSTANGSGVGTTIPAWTEAYTYDGFGNLLDKTSTGGAPTLQQAVNANSNQIVGQGYDANGNATNYGSYDYENRLAGSGGDLFSYGPDNLRTYKNQSNGTEYVYFYDPYGHRMGAYEISSPAWAQDNVYCVCWEATASWFGGMNLAGTDRLGSAESGYGYFPYGEEYTPSSSDGDDFATYYHDVDTGLDYAKHRYYNSILGRFLSADPSKSNALADPGQWNKYAYSANDPVNFYDPAGMFAYGAGAGGSSTPPNGYCYYAPLDPLCNPQVGPPANPQNSMNAAGQAQQQWQDASDALYAAAQFIEDKKSWSTKCKNDLGDVISPKTLPNGLEVDAVSQLQQAAASVTFFDGTVSGTLYNTLYAGVPNLQRALGPTQQTETIAQAFASSPSTSAMAALLGNTIYVNPQQINSYGSGFLIGTVMHELLHNITGLTDPDLMSHFPYGGRGSIDISVALFSDCVF